MYWVSASWCDVDVCIYRTYSYYVARPRFPLYYCMPRSPFFLFSRNSPSAAGNRREGSSSPRQRFLAALRCAAPWVVCMYVCMYVHVRPAICGMYIREPALFALRAEAVSRSMEIRGMDVCGSFRYRVVSCRVVSGIYCCIHGTAPGGNRVSHSPPIETVIQIPTDETHANSSYEEGELFNVLQLPLGVCPRLFGAS
ncbi:hypothetical protein P280DRAFT_39225 [Massarina eburnea CBS 473.64]|uniref:Uncharacterized protein n=1 Tax=Massarina eburnea CBS 473.64 TaxID=1395130 RepID=A0A6A6RYK2_9PLEO|nr:hypothetical protein P280DRAFT_39225 [Massarina eburnea CBS 473.64]